jgi:hypothetical protein
MKTPTCGSPSLSPKRVLSIPFRLQPTPVSQVVEILQSQLLSIPLSFVMASERVVQISMAPEAGVVPASDEIHENEWYNQDFDGYRIEEHPIFEKRPIRMICVGAGAAGLQVAYKAEKVLKNVKLQIYEKNHDVGGTWLENRYPGCTCDIPSHS